MADQRNTIEVLARHLISATRPLIEAGSSFGAFKRLMARLVRRDDLPPAYAVVATAVTNAVNRIDTFPRRQRSETSSRCSTMPRRSSRRSRTSPPDPPPRAPTPCVCDRDRRAPVRAAADRLPGDRAPGAFNVLAMLNVIGSETSRRRHAAVLRTHPFPLGRAAQGDQSTRATCRRAYMAGGAGFQRSSWRSSTSARSVVALGLPVALPRSDADAMSAAISARPVHAAAVRSRSAAVLPRQLRRTGRSRPRSRCNGCRRRGRRAGTDARAAAAVAIPLEFQLHPRRRCGCARDESRHAVRHHAPPAAIGAALSVRARHAAAAVGVGVDFDFTPAAPVVLLGDPNASRIEFTAASVDFGGGFLERPLVASARQRSAKACNWCSTPGEGDSFIKQIIGDGQDHGRAFRSAWSGRRQNGIRFKGSAAFEVALHPHLRSGRVRVDEVDRQARRAARRAAADQPRNRRRHLGRARPARILRAGASAFAPTSHFAARQRRPARPRRSASSRRTASALPSTPAASAAAASSSSTPPRANMPARSSSRFAGFLSPRRSASSTPRCPTARRASRC